MEREGVGEKLVTSSLVVKIGVVVTMTMLDVKPLLPRGEREGEDSLLLDRDRLGVEVGGSC